MTSNNNALAIIEPGSLAIAATDDNADNFPTLFEEAGLSFFDLERVSVPTGGGKFFTVEDLDGERAESEIEGVIALIQANQRSYHATAYGEGESGPPDCSSTDGVEGYGNRYLSGVEDGAEAHECASCPHNAWASRVRPDGTQGKGKACREFMRLVVFTKDALVPTLVVAPPTSLKGVRRFMLRLAKYGIRPHEILVKIGIQVEEIGGYPTAMLKLSAGGRLSDEEAARMLRLHDKLGPLFEPFLRPALQAERPQEEREVKDEDEWRDAPSVDVATAAETTAAADASDAPSESEVAEADEVAGQ